MQFVAQAALNYRKAVSGVKRVEQRAGFIASEIGPTENFADNEAGRKKCGNRNVYGVRKEPLNGGGKSISGHNGKHAESVVVKTGTIGKDEKSLRNPH